MSADHSVSAITFTLTLFSLNAWRKKPICNEVVDWSMARSCICAEYGQREREGTADRVELNAGLQTRQKERYVILFFNSSGGRFYIRISSNALALPPLSVKNRGGGGVNRLCAFNRKNTVCKCHSIFYTSDQPETCIK